MITLTVMAGSMYFDQGVILGAAFRFSTLLLRLCYQHQLITPLWPLLVLEPVLITMLRM
jgi:hypothetical protein